ncbi:MAG: hypothetical protein HQM11_09660 [SAR324 cluster bacterium]|nr:hypothetical protein [SAR324 cluster bacterium]
MKPNNSVLLWSILTVLIIATVGCYPSNINHQWGWTTTEIRGSVHQPNQQPIPGSFILVQQYYSQFVQMQDEPPVFTPRAKLVFPGSAGQFVIPFDYRASKISMAVIASGFQTEHLYFNRQIGVGNLEWNVELHPTPAWKEHFLILLNPFLQGLILDKRYALEDAHQLFLGDWLEQQKENLSTGP